MFGDLGAARADARRRERCLHCGSRHVEYAYRRVAAYLREDFKWGSLRIKLAVFFGALPIALECVERLMRFRIRLPAAAREKIGALVFDEPRHIGWRISKNESDFVGEPRFALRRFELLSGKCRLRSALANMGSARGRDAFPWRSMERTALVSVLV